MAFQSLGTSTRFNATSVGIADFVVASAPAGYLTPEQSNVTDGKVYSYYAQSSDGTQWEAGSGVYTVSTHTLARTTIKGTSNGDQALVVFAGIPIVDVFPSPPTIELTPVLIPIPSGTLMLFQQTSAPTGWTKQTAHNDKALRVVSGTASSGGTNSFSSMFASRTSDATTLSIGQIPAHAHSYNDLVQSPAPPAPTPTVATGAEFEFDQTGFTSGSQGGGGSHSHTYDMRVQYVDLIIAQKN